MAETDIRDDLSKVYRWLGMCIAYYENLEDEDGMNQRLASQMRDNPNEPLDALIQIRLSHFTYMMRSNLSQDVDKPRVQRKDIKKMLKSFAPIENNDWWPVWMSYLDTMSDAEWNQMWIDIDLTVTNMLNARK